MFTNYKFFSLISLKSKFIKVVYYDILVSEEQVKINISYDEYAKKIVDQCAFNIACLATVHDTNYEYFAQDDFRVRKPDIKFKVICYS